MDNHAVEPIGKSDFADYFKRKEEDERIEKLLLRAVIALENISDQLAKSSGTPSERKRRG